jgi:hypothetical protein
MSSKNSRSDQNFGGSGKALSRQIWAISKKNKNSKATSIMPLKEIAFKTKSEVDNYLNNEKIECLVCGNCYTKLGTHLIQAHEVDPYKYKRILGLPTGRGLAGTVLRAKVAENTRQMHVDGKIDATSLPNTPRNYAPKQHPQYWHNGRREKLNENTQKQVDKGKVKLEMLISFLEERKEINSSAVEEIAAKLGWKKSYCEQVIRRYKRTLTQK